jgi:GTPase SAR1 family protein
MEVETGEKYKWNIGSEQNKPIAAIVIGMAGSGKSTLMQRINSYVHTKKYPSYIINLDPAVAEVNYNANIDIRDSINYKEVMKQYSLGPNGGILTSLNLFATRFDQVMGIVEKRAPELQYIFLDTPGQIEVFNWSASGIIITESLASYFPTCIIYVCDTPQSLNTTTFMSNMLYACSLFYKSKIPMIVVFNKVDIVSHQFAVKWMTDEESFHEACQKSDSYMQNFVSSMSMMIGEFYKNFSCIGVSAITGQGMDALFEALEKAAIEYNSGYKVELVQLKQEKAKREEDRKSDEISKLKRDIEEGKKVPLVSHNPMKSMREKKDLNDDEF